MNNQQALGFLLPCTERSFFHYDLVIYFSFIATQIYILLSNQIISFALPSSLYYVAYLIALYDNHTVVYSLKSVETLVFI